MTKQGFEWGKSPRNGSTRRSKRTQKLLEEFPRLVDEIRRDRLRAGALRISGTHNPKDHVSRGGVRTLR